MNNKLDAWVRTFKTPTHKDYEYLEKTFGFSKEDLKHIFERFYRGQNKQKNGIGIGMAMVKEIVEAHHGSIHIYNQNGAVFEIYLPKIFAKKKL